VAKLSTTGREPGAASGTLGVAVISVAGRWLPATLQAIAIFWFSHQPSPPGADLGPDYMLHGVGYAALAALLVWGATDCLRRPITPSAAGWCWLAASLYGVLDEFHQSYVPGRSSTVSDVLADAAGAAVAILLALVLFRKR